MQKANARLQNNTNEMQVHILLVLTALCFPTTKASRHPVFVALNDGRDKKANSDVTILGLGAAAQWLNDPGDRTPQVTPDRD